MWRWIGARSTENRAMAIRNSLPGCRYPSHCFGHGDAAAGGRGGRASGGMEVLMMGRHADSGVLGGAHVFPGGKVDRPTRTAGMPWADRTA